MHKCALFDAIVLVSWITPDLIKLAYMTSIPEQILVSLVHLHHESYIWSDKKYGVCYILTCLSKWNLSHHQTLTCKTHLSLAPVKLSETQRRIVTLFCASSTTSNNCGVQTLNLSVSLLRLLGKANFSVRSGHHDIPVCSTCCRLATYCLLQLSIITGIASHLKVLNPSTSYIHTGVLLLFWLRPIYI